MGASDCRTGETCCWGIQTKINGVCGTSKFTCKAGTVDDGAVADTSTYYKWICRGVGTGITNSGKFKRPLTRSQFSKISPI